MYFFILQLEYGGLRNDVGNYSDPFTSKLGQDDQFLELLLGDAALEVQPRVPALNYCW